MGSKQERRRGRAAWRAAAVAAALATAFAAGWAGAQQQLHMENALAALQTALGELRQAEPNKGGHRERAIGLVEDAIAQVQQGITWAEGSDDG